MEIRVQRKSLPRVFFTAIYVVFSELPFLRTSKWKYVSWLLCSSGNILPQYNFNHCVNQDKTTQKNMPWVVPSLCCPTRSLGRSSVTLSCTGLYHCSSTTEVSLEFPSSRSSVPGSSQPGRAPLGADFSLLSMFLSF